MTSMKYFVVLAVMLVGACDQNREGGGGREERADGGRVGEREPRRQAQGPLLLGRRRVQQQHEQVPSAEQPDRDQLRHRNQWLAARWTCGTAPTMGTDNGRSCAVGDPCALAQDSSCVGMVQECSYPRYDAR
jgi:hypothetical protein